MKAALIVLIFITIYLSTYFVYYVIVPAFIIFRHTCKHNVKWRYDPEQDAIVIFIPENKYFGIQGVLASYKNENSGIRNVIWYIRDCYILCYEEMLRRGIKHD